MLKERAFGKFVSAEGYFHVSVPIQFAVFQKVRRADPYPVAFRGHYVHTHTHKCEILTAVIYEYISARELFCLSSQQ